MYNADSISITHLQCEDRVAGSKGYILANINNIADIWVFVTATVVRCYTSAVQGPITAVLITQRQPHFGSEMSHLRVTRFSRRSERPDVAAR